jgi:hypothetical protein
LQASRAQARLSGLMRRNSLAPWRLFRRSASLHRRASGKSCLVYPGVRGTHSDKTHDFHVGRDQNVCAKTANFWRCKSRLHVFRRPYQARSTSPRCTRRRADREPPRRAASSRSPTIDAAHEGCLALRDVVSGLRLPGSRLGPGCASDADCVRHRRICRDGAASRPDRLHSRQPSGIFPVTNGLPAQSAGRRRRRPWRGGRLAVPSEAVPRQNQKIVKFEFDVSLTVPLDNEVIRMRACELRQAVDTLTRSRPSGTSRRRRSRARF